MPTWSSLCIDESAGFDIVDCLTGRVYSEDEARQQPPEIRSRLIMRPRKLGRYVMTFEEAKAIRGH